MIFHPVLYVYVVLFMLHSEKFGHGPPRWTTAGWRATFAFEHNGEDKLLHMHVFVQ